MSLKNNHALHYFYDQAPILAHCDEMPNHVLVCYEEQNEQTMLQALANVKLRYGDDTAFEENPKNTPGLTAFWLPKSKPLNPMQMPHPSAPKSPQEDSDEISDERTDEFEFLQAKIDQQVAACKAIESQNTFQKNTAKKPEIIVLHATDFRDLHAQLPGALHNVHAVRKQEQFGLNYLGNN